MFSLMLDPLDLPSGMWIATCDRCGQEFRLAIRYPFSYSGDVLLRDLEFHLEKHTSSVENSAPTM